MNKKLIVSAIVLLIIMAIIITVSMMIKNKERTIQEIIDIDFKDISYVVHDKDNNYDLSDFLKEFENRKFNKKKKSKLIGQTVAFTILCYDNQNNIICTIKCNGYGYYIVQGELKDTSKLVLYDYGEFK